MMKARISKNGMINFPAEVRKRLKVDYGDEISFIFDEKGGLTITPIKNLMDLINPNETEIANKICDELKEEHRRED